MSSAIHTFLRKSEILPPVKHEAPLDLLRSAAEYFEWIDSHPLKEEVAFHSRGLITRTSISKLRPYTKQGLATYLGIPLSRLELYRKRGEDWAEAVELIEQIMFDQKFAGAAAGLLNAAIIGRDLGLADRQEITGRDGEPLQQVVQYQLPSNGRDHVEPDPTDASDASDA